MGVIVPVVTFAVLLGRAFDMNNMIYPGAVIFDDAVVAQNTLNITNAFVTSTYKLSDSSADSCDYIDVDGNLALKIKSGHLDFSGFGKYVKEVIDRSRTVELLLKVHHETITQTFPSYIPCKDKWKHRPQAQVGTHYVRSVVYGGKLLISYRMVANSLSDMEHIKSAAATHLNISGSVDINAKGSFDKFESSISGRCNITIQVAATAGAISPPTSINDALELMEKYPDMVKNISGGKGSPLAVEVVALSTLLSDYTTYAKNNALESILDDATNKYDDIRNSRTIYRNFDCQHCLPYTPYQQEMIDQFVTAMEYARKNMTNAIEKFDMSSLKLDQFDEAFKAYGTDNDNVPQRYTRWINKIIANITGEKPIWYPYTDGVTHYIHWGARNCTTPSPAPVYVGYGVSAPRNYGNGADFICFPEKSPNDAERVLPTSALLSKITALRYDAPEHNKIGQLACAHCQLQNASDVFTISGTTDCPMKTKREYYGYLMTDLTSGTASEVLCLDKYLEDVTRGDSSFTGLLTPIWADCLTCKNGLDKTFVPCAVCSR